MLRVMAKFRRMVYALETYGLEIGCTYVLHHFEVLIESFAFWAVLELSLLI